MTRFINAAAPGVILPRGELYWTSLEMYNSKTRRPSYNVTETSSVFFGRSRQWFCRHVIYGGSLDDMDLVYDGRGRRFRLVEIESIAHHLASRRVIDGRQLLIAVEMLKLQARVWGYGRQIDQLLRRAGNERQL